MRKLPFFSLLILPISLLVDAVDLHHEIASMNVENDQGMLPASNKAYINLMKDMHNQINAGGKARRS